MLAGRASLMFARCLLGRVNGVLRSVDFCSFVLASLIGLPMIGYDVRC